jgi:hypothetical protein
VDRLGCADEGQSLGDLLPDRPGARWGIGVEGQLGQLAQCGLTTFQQFPSCIPLAFQRHQFGQPVQRSGMQ